MVKSLQGQAESSKLTAGSPGTICLPAHLGRTQTGHQKALVPCTVLYNVPAYTESHITLTLAGKAGSSSYARMTGTNEVRNTHAVGQCSC